MSAAQDNKNAARKTKNLAKEERSTKQGKLWHKTEENHRPALSLLDRLMAFEVPLGGGPEELLLSLFVFAAAADDITLWGKGLLEVGETTLDGCCCCCCCGVVSGRLLLEVEEAAVASTRWLAATPPPPPPSEEVELRLSETLGLEEDMGEAAPLTAVEDEDDDAAAVGFNGTPPAAVAPRGRLLPAGSALVADALSSFNLT